MRALFIIVVLASGWFGFARLFSGDVWAFLFSIISIQMVGLTNVFMSRNVYLEDEVLSLIEISQFYVALQKAQKKAPGRPRKTK